MSRIENAALIYGEEGFGRELLWKKPAQYLTDRLRNAGFSRIARADEFDGSGGAVLALRSDAVPRDMGALVRALGDFAGGTLALRLPGGELIGCIAAANEVLSVLENGAPDAAKYETVDCERGFLASASEYERFALSERLNRESILRLMACGVRFCSLDGILICPDAVIGSGSEILPGTIIKGGVTIGGGCVIGASSVIEDSSIGDGCTINASQVYSSSIGNGVRIGPFSHIRPGCTVRDGVKIGDFVELKNSVIGEKTSVAHLTYVGDSDVGDRVNFGCGCVTVNYDGRVKSRTVIGDNVFIGCNTNLIAPVTVEDGSYIAAGSTITDTVPSDSLAIARARQVVKNGWARRRREKN